MTLFRFPIAPNIKIWKRFLEVKNSKINNYITYS